MLKSLRISNFALVESAIIEFQTGLNIITGETGAGKSIIIDALACVLGERTSLDHIRTGQEFLRVEAVFDLTGHQTGLSYLEELAIPIEDESNIILTRRLSLAGKNIVLINGCQTTVHGLKKFTQSLIDIHGQHESQALLRPELYISQLDSFSPVITTHLEHYRSLYREWKAVAARLEEAAQKSQERERRLDMLLWQSEEIAAACLKPDEDIDLEQQIKILANSEKIVKSVHLAYSLLSGEADEKRGVVSQLSEAKKAVEQAARFDEKLNQQAGLLTETLCQLQEVEHDLQNYFQEMEFNPARLSQLQTRMDTIYKLKKKYGNTTADILEYYKLTVSEMAELQNIEEHVEQLRKQSSELEGFLTQASEQLDVLRRAAGSELAGLIGTHLRDLGMTGAQFVAEVQRTDSFNERGKNQVHFLFTANHGEEPKPLNKVASGGELSRIALAMKAVNAAKDENQSMVFDELDAGIGGKTAQMVAEKIAFVSIGKQILCITHLPHIAVMGDCHFYIEKIVDNEITKTVVHKLETTAKINEIARMISGDDQSRASLENATKMLYDAEAKKEIWKKKAQA